MKNVSDWGVGNSGIVSNGKKLAYGLEHGFGVGWLPHQIQHLVVCVWNHIACYIWGHDEMAEQMAFEGYKIECFDCCKILRATGKEPWAE